MDYYSAIFIFLAVVLSYNLCDVIPGHDNFGLRKQMCSHKRISPIILFGIIIAIYLLLKKHTK
jgi:hypothetical protein